MLRRARIESVGGVDISLKMKKKVPSQARREERQNALSQFAALRVKEGTSTKVKYLTTITDQVLYSVK